MVVYARVGGDPLGEQPASEASTATASEAHPSAEVASSVEASASAEAVDGSWSLMSSYAHRRANWTSYQDLERRRWRTGRPYRTWRAKILRPAVLRCCRCGYLIDKRLKYPHPDSGEADHFPVPLSRWIPDGNPPPGAPAHRRCNLSAQNRMPDEFPAPVVKVADRRW